MFLLRKKKQRRDQGAGLVFRWRGAGGRHMGKMMAFALTCGFFGFSAYALRVEGLRSPLLSKQTAQVVMLNDGDPHCQRLLEQVENRSPFPPRWDPAFDVQTMMRIFDAVGALDGPIWEYRPAMEQYASDDASDADGGMLGLPSVLEKDAGFFSGSVDVWSGVAGENASSGRNTSDHPRVSVKVVADCGIQKRLPSGELLLPDDLMADEWFGQSFRFLVGIDSLGVVRGCLSLSGGSMEVAKPTEKQKMLAAWLRRMTFKPSDHDTLVIGVLELQIEARSE
jgi:hypothetical protein